MKRWVTGSFILVCFTLTICAQTGKERRTGFLEEQLLILILCLRFMIYPIRLTGGGVSVIKSSQREQKKE